MVVSRLKHKAAVKHNGGQIVIDDHEAWHKKLALHLAACEKEGKSKSDRRDALVDQEIRKDLAAVDHTLSSNPIVSLDEGEGDAIAAQQHQLRCAARKTMQMDIARHGVLMEQRAQQMRHEEEVVNAFIARNH